MLPLNDCRQATAGSPRRRWAWRWRSLPRRPAGIERIAGPRTCTALLGERTGELQWRHGGHSLPGNGLDGQVASGGAFCMASPHNRLTSTLHSCNRCRAAAAAEATRRDDGRPVVATARSSFLRHAARPLARGRNACVPSAAGTDFTACYNGRPVRGARTPLAARQHSSPPCAAFVPATRTPSFRAASGTGHDDLPARQPPLFPEKTC